MAKEHGELLLQSRAWLREVRQLIKQCDVMLKEVSPEHVEDVRSLQLTLIEIVNDAGDDESLASSDAPAILAREEMHELQRRIARDATPQSASARFLCCC
ncbi:MAG: hypothetical protein SGPRY_011482 [Prymnesium sp.]